MLPILSYIKSINTGLETLFNNLPDELLSAHRA